MEEIFTPLSPQNRELLLQLIYQTTESDQERDQWLAELEIATDLDAMDLETALRY